MQSKRCQSLHRHQPPAMGRLPRKTMTDHSGWVASKRLHKEFASNWQPARSRVVLSLAPTWGMCFSVKPAGRKAQAWDPRRRYARPASLFMHAGNLSNSLQGAVELLPTFWKADRRGLGAETANSLVLVGDERQSSAAAPHQPAKRTR